MTVRLGVDAGGTFTDVCVLTDDGSIVVYKLPSTPQDPSQAIVDGANEGLQEAGVRASDLAYFGHGTTVATNALLEGRGARTGIITTDGFRDLLEIGRQQRPDLYDLQVEKPPVLVRRRDRLEVAERMRHDGCVEKPLDLQAARDAVNTLKSRGVEAVAVCFLYSYLYPEHEQMLAEIVADEFPDAYLSLSHRVLAEFREYERLSTTVVNAFVGTVMSRYIERLRDRVRDLDIPVDPYITQSNGGLISLDVAREIPVRTMLSGPAAGVIGATQVAEAAGIENIITFDMGGTSSDVSLIDAGKPRIGLDMAVSGYPIRAPMIDIHTVGAGGGSIAWIDSGGHLKVGPASAGADPGPAGYGRGGTDATVTDANLALGVLNRETLLGGRMDVDAAAADDAVGTLAKTLDMDPVAVAGGILAVVTANMTRAIRVISIERGYDPRDFALVAFGGAGPLHAARLARALEIPRVIVPPAPGILCALGQLVSDLRRDFSRTMVTSANAETLPTIDCAFRDLEAEAAAWLDQERIDIAERLYRKIADMRYVGQNYELSVEIPEGEFSEQQLQQVVEQFHQSHEATYGFAAEDEPVQFVTIRLEAFGTVPTAMLQELPLVTQNDRLPEIGRRQVYLAEWGGWFECPVYQRERFRQGHEFKGPAVVEQMDSTTLVLPEQRVVVDRIGNLVIEEIEGQPDDRS